MRKVSLDKLDALFAAISANEKLYLPVDGKDGAAYKVWEAGDVWSKALNTVRSPKDFFFPQTENLMAFRTSGKTIQIEDTRTETEDFIVFGVRACDVRAFDVLDRVFLSNPVDTYYANRRMHGTIISVACTRPSETCFCQTFGIDAKDPAGDVAAWRTENAVYFEAKTEKGQKFVDSIADFTEECGSEAVDAQKEQSAKIFEKLPLASLKADSFGAGKTDKFFNDPAWSSLSASCLGCGTCTFVCPTCQCYDIFDFKTGTGVIRMRCWDSCMYSDFTKMSAGQPRVSQLERFRQRFMHKLVYYPENNDGLFSCVGCGRCLVRCPISMNIVKVMKTLGEGANNE